MLKQSIRIEIVEKLFCHTSSNEIVNSSLKLLIPRRNEFRKYVGTLGFCLIPSYFMAVSLDTVSLFLNGVKILNDVILALFGITFTGYALFQALIGKEMLKKMLCNTTGKGDREKSKLQESNELFVETMMLQLACIVVNVFLLVIGECIPESFCLFKNRICCNIITGIGMEIYFYISVITLLEMKSFIYNIFQLFNLHAGTRVIEILREEKENKE